MIRPTNGRQVWYHPNGTFLSVDGDKGQPLAATVVHVWGDNCVNLVVLDAEGRAIPLTSVRLLADGETPPTIGAYCDWMPFQKGQAKAQAAQSDTPDYVQRMIEERQALADKVIKLGEFISPANPEIASPFASLPHIEQRLMVEQFNAMETYLQALSARLALLGK